MRWITRLLLIVLLCTALVPSVPAFVPVHGEGLPQIGVIDVCHSGVPAIASSGDLPCMSENFSDLSPTFLKLFTQHDLPIQTHFLFAVQNDRPPKV